MNQYHAIETREVTDEWGTASIEVHIADVVVFAYDISGPAPQDRVVRQGLHQAAVRQFANRLGRLLSD